MEVTRTPYFIITNDNIINNDEKTFKDDLRNDSIDFERDGVGYSQFALHLSDDGFHHMGAGLRPVFANYIDNCHSIRGKG